MGKIVAHIPARAGSKRVASKNLRYIAGRPLMSYAVEAALKCARIDEVVVNTDGSEIAELAKRLGAKVYLRDPVLASDTASGDAFTYDFICKWEVDTLVMVSPVCPLVTTETIEDALNAYGADGDFDTLITTSYTHMQVFMHDMPVNIQTDCELAPSQENPPVHTLNWAVTIWDASAYRRNFEEHGYAYLGRNRRLFPIDPLQAVKISVEEDFHTAEALLKARSGADKRVAEASYWKPEETL